MRGGLIRGIGHPARVAAEGRPTIPQGPVAEVMSDSARLTTMTPRMRPTVIRCVRFLPMSMRPILGHALPGASWRPLQHTACPGHEKCLACVSAGQAVGVSDGT